LFTLYGLPVVRLLAVGRTPLHLTTARAVYARLDYALVRVSWFHLRFGGLGVTLRSAAFLFSVRAWFGYATTLPPIPYLHTANTLPTVVRTRCWTRSGHVAVVERCHYVVILYIFRPSTHLPLPWTFPYTGWLVCDAVPFGRVAVRLFGRILRALLFFFFFFFFFAHYRTPSFSTCLCRTTYRAFSSFTCTFVCTRSHYSPDYGLLHLPLPPYGGLWTFCRERPRVVQFDVPSTLFTIFLWFTATTVVTVLPSATSLGYTAAPPAHATDHSFYLPHCYIPLFSIGSPSHR
jgi:hypothetical protein